MKAFTFCIEHVYNDSRRNTLVIQVPIAYLEEDVWIMVDVGGIMKGCSRRLVEIVVGGTVVESITS